MTATSSAGYRSRRERAADACVHVVGVLAGGAGVVVLLVAAWSTGSGRALASASAYAIGLVAMFGCSAAYNLSPPSPRRDWLRRLDHAAIFVMIAGTYTPFTTLAPGGSAIGWTAGVWAAALAGVYGKLALPYRFHRGAVVLYLAMGWVFVAGFEPLTQALDPLTFDLLLAGGLLYSIGVVFHLWEALPFHKAVWHGLVLAAAVCHYIAVLRVTT